MPVWRVTEYHLNLVHMINSILDSLEWSRLNSWLINKKETKVCNSNLTEERKSFFLVSISFLFWAHSESDSRIAF